MTSELIEFFKQYAKFDKQSENYYINNLKTVFYFENRRVNYDDDIYMDSVENDIEQYKQHIKKTCDKWIYEEEISDLENKHVINQSTVSKVIDIFYYIDNFNFNFDEVYKSKFFNYILYVLEKKQTETTHKTNRYINNKKFKEWLISYDMNYNISRKFMCSSITKIEERINEIVDNKIKNNLSELINNNTDILKSLIINLNDESKEILINEIVEYHEKEIIKRVSNKLNKNKVADKMALKMIKECNDNINSNLNNKLNEFIKSESTNETFKKGIDDFMTYDNYLTKKIGYEKGSFNCKLVERINKISETIKELKVQYSNNSSNESSKDSNDNSNGSKDSNECSNDSNDNNDYENCFVKHGKLFNLKLGELMKHSKFEDITEFKTELIKKNIIKKDFKIAGSTYRLTEEQKKQFIINFKKL